MVRERPATPNSRPSAHAACWLASPRHSVSRVSSAAICSGYGVGAPRTRGDGRSVAPSSDSAHKTGPPASRDTVRREGRTQAWRLRHSRWAASRSATRPSTSAASGASASSPAEAVATHESVRSARQRSKSEGSVTSSPPAPPPESPALTRNPLSLGPAGSPGAGCEERCVMEAAGVRRLRAPLPPAARLPSTAMVAGRSTAPGAPCGARICTQEATRCSAMPATSGSCSMRRCSSSSTDGAAPRSCRVSFSTACDSRNLETQCSSCRSDLSATRTSRPAPRCHSGVRRNEAASNGALCSMSYHEPGVLRRCALARRHAADDSARGWDDHLRLRLLAGPQHHKPAMQRQ